MNNIMNYKGYWARINYSDEDKCFWGKVEELENDLILFEGETVEELRKDFEDAIDMHIESCKRDKKEPKKQYRGSFNVRIKPELHKQAANIARTLNISLNQFVEMAISKQVNHK